MTRETFTHKLNSILMMHGLDEIYVVCMHRRDGNKIYLFNTQLGHSACEERWDEYADPCLMLCNLFQGEYIRYDENTVHASFVANVMHGFQCLSGIGGYIENDMTTECVASALKGGE